MIYQIHKKWPFSRTGFFSVTCFAMVQNLFSSISKDICTPIAKNRKHTHTRQGWSVQSDTAVVYVVKGRSRRQKINSTLCLVFTLMKRCKNWLSFCCVCVCESIKHAAVTGSLLWVNTLMLVKSGDMLFVWYINHRVTFSEASSSLQSQLITLATSFLWVQSVVDLSNRQDWVFWDVLQNAFQVFMKVCGKKQQVIILGITLVGE